MGRPGPLRGRADSSLLMPTTSTSPNWLAACRLRKWPACSRSKQPLVHTTVRPSWRWRARRDRSEDGSTILSRQVVRMSAIDRSGDYRLRIGTTGPFADHPLEPSGFFLAENSLEVYES